LPKEDPQLSLSGHQIFLVVNGIHLLENLKLDELVAKKVYEFALAMQPLKMQGGRAPRCRRSLSGSGLRTVDAAKYV
jgi:hypothetical protein